MISTGMIGQCSCTKVHYEFHYRGEPGIDWDINNPSQSDISKVFYGVIDPNVALSSSKCSYQYIHCTYVCVYVHCTYVSIKRISVIICTYIYIFHIDSYSL